MAVRAPSAGPALAGGNSGIYQRNPVRGKPGKPVLRPDLTVTLWVFIEPKDLFGQQYSRFQYLACFRPEECIFSRAVVTYNLPLGWCLVPRGKGQSEHRTMFRGR